LEEPNRAIYKIPAEILFTISADMTIACNSTRQGRLLVPGVWFQYDIVATGNHYEVTLTNTQSGATQVTTIFDNPDTARGIATLGGQPAGFIGIQSYPSSPMAFRDIWIK